MPGSSRRRRAAPPLACLSSLLLAACGIEAESRDAHAPADARVVAPAASRPGPDGWYDGTRFFARNRDGRARPLELRSLRAEVTTRPGTVRSRAALAVLSGPGKLATRLFRVADFMMVDATSEPEALAWSIGYRSAASLRTVVLVARLLVLAGRDHDAARVLSEYAARDPEAVASEMRRLLPSGAGDASEVWRLTRRARAEE